MVHQERCRADRLASESLDGDCDKTSDEEDETGERRTVQATSRPQASNQSETSDTNLRISSCTLSSTNQQHGQDETQARDEPLGGDNFWYRTRIHVALLGLAIAVVNCYAQATFCIAIVEMVLPSDYTAELNVSSNPLATSSNSTSNHFQSDQSCPIEFKYRKYYDDWRFDTTNATTTTSAKEHQQHLDTSNRFAWDASQQGLLLGAFAVGTAPLQILGGRLAEIYGAKWVLLMGCIGTGLTNLAIPYLAHFSLVLLIVNRILMGVAQAGMEPGLMCLLADWLTPQEASFFISMLLFALCLGFFLGSLCSSFILALGYGWPLTYYVCAGLNLVVALVWYIYADSWPRASRHISRQELAFIEAEQARAKSTTAGSGARLDPTGAEPQQTGPVPREDPLRTPWMNILRSRPVWAFIICKISIRWCADVMSNELPTYLANVLHLSIKINGLLNSVSSALFAISSFITGWLATSKMFTTPRASFNPSRHDPSCCPRMRRLISEGVDDDEDEVDDLNRELSREGQRRDGCCLGCQQDEMKMNARKTNLRKAFQSLASFGSAICLILMTQYDCDILLSMGCLLLLSWFIVMGSGGELQIAYDMTSRYPGTLHGMACTLSVSGWLAPPLYGLILGDQPNSRTRWSLVWYSTAAINLLGGLVFVLFADASPRDFDQKKTRRKTTTTRGNSERRDLNTDLEHDGGYCNGALSGSSCESSPKSSHQQADERGQLAVSKLNPLEANISFDCGRLVRCRQLESSFMPPTKLDSPLWLKAGDLIYPYRESSPPIRAAAAAGQPRTSPALTGAVGSKQSTWRQLARRSWPFNSRFKFLANSSPITAAAAAATGTGTRITSSSEARNGVPIRQDAKSISELANGHHHGETINQSRGSHTHSACAGFRSAEQAHMVAPPMVESWRRCSSVANDDEVNGGGGGGILAAATILSPPYCTPGLGEPAAAQNTSLSPPIGPEALRPETEAARQGTITHL